MQALIILLLLFSSLVAQAQDNLKNNEVLYSVSIGLGTGHSSNFGKSIFGIGGMADFTFQKNKTIGSLAYHGIAEFELFITPSTTMNSIDLLYGKVLSKSKASISLQTGIGFVGGVEKGQYLYHDPGFGLSHYEVIRSFNIGLPISSKALISLSKKFSLGLDGYVNLNKINTFYVINLCAAFTRL